MIGLKPLLRSLIPPFAWQMIRRFAAPASSTRWQGDYNSWAEAMSRSSSYNTQEILQRVLRATIEVEEGRAACERDGCNFSEVAYSWPLLSSLLWVYARDKRLAVLDIGGSLGTTWRQNRKFLASLSALEWMVVEQPDFVQVGQERLQRAPLTFHTSVDECLDRRPNVALLSSSLQYMEDPWKLLDQLARSGVSYVILDRTPLNSNTRDRLAVQTVAPHIYSASYPCWIFSRSEFERKMLQHWKRVESWQAMNEHYTEFDLRGYLFEK